jgi:hypothetical protein
MRPWHPPLLPAFGYPHGIDYYFDVIDPDVWQTNRESRYSAKEGYLNESMARHATRTDSYCELRSELGQWNVTDSGESPWRRRR